MNQVDYWKLHTLFHSGYAGYRPNVIELPNGDGKADTDKRYLHIATKYNPPDWAMDLLIEAYSQAVGTALHMGVPNAFMPDLDACALRVLEYPPGVGGHLHTDFDLFTLNLYRSVNSFPDFVHLGELGEAIGLGPAYPHEVKPMGEYQYSAVFFALPSPTAVLPSGEVVGDWLQKRLARSRAAR